jgi:hypothetical protein
MSAIDVDLHSRGLLCKYGSSSPTIAKPPLLLNEVDKDN